MSVIIEELPNDPPEPVLPPGKKAAQKHEHPDEQEFFEASEHLHGDASHDQEAEEDFADCHDGLEEHEHQGAEQPATAIGHHQEQEALSQGPSSASEPQAAAGTDLAEPRDSGDKQAEEAEAELSPEAYDEAVQMAERLKQEGNEAYSAGTLDVALGKYEQALQTAPAGAKQQRATYAANKAAVQMQRENWKEAIRDCSEALEADPGYVKALLRRAAAYEKIDDLERTLQDYEKVVELQPGNSAAVGNVRRLMPIVEKKREEMKEEMIGKLKDLGNMVLGKFGMSVDNFKAVKDPATGSYSINYQNS